MKKLQLVGVSFVALLVAGGVADAGRGKPKWCRSDMEQEGDDYLKKGDFKHQLQATAYVLCTPDQQHDADAAANADAKYKELSARFGFTDDDWADVAAWSGDVDRYSMKRPDQKKPWSQLTPMEQYVSVEHNWIGSENRQGSLDPATFVDALGPKLSELARLAWLDKCLTAKGNHGYQVLWALCQPDVEAFDAKKVLAEIKAEPSYAPNERMMVRVEAVEMQQRIADHAAEMKALLASDPIYGQMVDMVKKAHADWAGRWKSPSPALAMMGSMEDALVTNSRHATEGCKAKTWDVLKAVVPKIPAKQFEIQRKEKEYDTEYMRRLRETVSEALLNDVDGYNAAVAYTMCWAIEPLNDMHEKRPDALGQAVEQLASRWPGYRGPRTAAWTNIMKAGLTPDDRDARIDYPDVSRPYLDPNRNGSFGGTMGTVTKATPKGDQIHLEFLKHKVKWLQQYGCHNTNHIRGVMANGEFDYEYVCAGATEKTSEEGPSPYDVNKDTGAVVKPGMVIAAFADELFAAWKDSKATVPQLVLGQPVK